MTIQSVRLDAFLARQSAIYDSALEDITRGAAKLIATLPKPSQANTDGYGDSSQAPDIATASYMQAAVGCMDNAFRLYELSFNLSMKDRAMAKQEKSGEATNGEKPPMSGAFRVAIPSSLLSGKDSATEEDGKERLAALSNLIASTLGKVLQDDNDEEVSDCGCPDCRAAAMFDEAVDSLDEIESELDEDTSN